MTTHRSQKVVVAVLSALSAVVVFGLGFALGNHNLTLRSGFVPTLANTALGQPKNIDFNEFWNVYQKVQDNYVSGGDIKPQDQLYGSIKGMVAALGDPYSYFLTPQENKDFFTSLNGKLEGIGAEVGQQNNEIVIIAPLDGSPAQKAGLQPGDQVVAVDGKDVSQQTLDAVVNEIRGPKGSSVKLTIIPKGEKNTKDVTITRDTITVPSVVSSVRDDGIGVIRISQFGETTGDDAVKAAQDLATKHVKGVVLDLRSNPGGFLDGAVKIASIWIKDGPIVFEQYRDGHKDTFNASGSPVLNGVPLAVLVDNGSASASEIVSGAIQDDGAGRLFGVKTFGKGSVQDVTQLSDDSALRLTIAKWLTPKGRSINHEGIVPDEVVETPKDSGTTKADPVLDHALTWLKTQTK